MLKTMEWRNDGKLLLLDQTMLPGDVSFLLCEDYKTVIDAIKKLRVRGAPAIGAAAGFAMVLAFREILQENEDGNEMLSSEVVLQKYTALKEEINSARPTAVNLSWATQCMYEGATAMVEAGLAVSEMYKELEKLAISIYGRDIIVNKKLGSFGAEVVPEEAVVLTHCNAGALATCGWGTALGVVRSAGEQGKIKHVYSDETRPLLQGSRLTAWELMEDNIPVSTITDGMAAWTMKKKGVNIIITGADRIATNGDTANKIGTYGVALAAKAHNIPFYIAAPASTFDFSLKTGEEIPIEERDADEIRYCGGKQTAPADVPVFNPAFDVTPAELISGIITEYGVLKAPFEKSIKELEEKVNREEALTWKVSSKI